MLIPIPYAADRPLRRFPIVTLFLVALNCTIFLLSLLGGTETLAYLVQNYGLRGWRPQGMDPGQYTLTLFTSLLLHASAMHLIINVSYLWLFGCLVEDALGRGAFLLFYISSGIAGGALRVAAEQSVLDSMVTQPAVGASGAVAGILGVFAIRFYRARIKALLFVPIAVPALPAIGLWIGVQMAFAVWSLYSQTGTGAWAHTGGFAFGLISGLLMRLGREAEEEYLLEDGRRERSARNLKRAIRNLGELLRRNPCDPQVHLELARAFYQAEQLDAAGLHACQAVELTIRAGNVDLAVAHYTTLMPLGILGGLSLNVEYRIACALESQQRLREAGQAYKNVFQRYPEAPEAEIALIRCAQVLRRHPEGVAEAAALYREYLERYPEGEWRALAMSHAGG